MKGEYFSVGERKIEIKDYYVILSLHKALLEAKFHLEPDNMEVPFSPFVADFCNELVDTLAMMDAEKDKKNIGKWDNWRMLKNQSFYRNRALNHAKSDNRWRNMDKEEKVKMARNLLSPFKATDEEIECFIKDVDMA